jgi:hypothetical protein
MFVEGAEEGTGEGAGETCTGLLGSEGRMEELAASIVGTIGSGVGLVQAKEAKEASTVAACSLAAAVSRLDRLRLV